MTGFQEAPLYLLDSATLFPSLPLLYGTARNRNEILEFEVTNLCAEMHQLRAMGRKRYLA